MTNARRNTGWLHAMDRGERFRFLNEHGKPVGPRYEVIASDQEGKWVADKDRRARLVSAQFVVVKRITTQ